MNAVAGLEPHVTDAFVVEYHPALQYVDDLEFERVRVMAGLSGTVRVGPDDLRMVPAPGCGLDTEVAILVERTQAIAAKLAVLGVADAESRRGGHGLLCPIMPAALDAASQVKCADEETDRQDGGGAELAAVQPGGDGRVDALCVGDAGHRCRDQAAR